MGQAPDDYHSLELGYGLAVGSAPADCRNACYGYVHGNGVIMTMPDEGTSGGGFMSQKFMGIPAIVWLIGAAVIAYLWFSKQQAASGQTAPASSTANQGTVTQTTGATTIDTGAVQVDVNAGGAGGTGLGGSVSNNPQSATSSTSTGSATTTAGGTTGSGATSTSSGTAGSNPQPAPSTPASSPAASVPNLDGLSLSSALAAVQNAGWQVSSVSYNYQNLSPSQYGQYGSTAVYSYTPNSSNNTVAIGLQ
jgi:hypothetical protein